MTSELTALGALVLVHMVLGLAAAVCIGQITGSKWLLGSRDTLPDYRKGLAGRLERARNNGFEALILFTPAVAMVTLSGTASTMTGYAAWTFVATRVIYTACYAADLVPWRSIVWFVGWFAILVMILAALVGA